MRTLTCFFLFAAIACGFSCTKIDSTTLGGSLVPDVDGVNTFDTTLDVITETYPLADDTLKLSYSDEMAVGHINDPLLGQSDATMFFELKPSLFPASGIAVNARDSSVGFDSTVLCLKYLGGYGDTTLPVTFQVFAIRSTAVLPDTLRRDTVYPIRKSFVTETSPLGSKQISLLSLSKDSFSVSRGTVVNYKTLRELRIPLTAGPNNKSWSDLLKDSVFLSGDSSFRRSFAGFAVRIQQGGNPGSMAYFSLTDTATKLQFFYRRKNGLATNVIDTTSTNFYFSTALSGYANNVTWDKAIGREAATHFGSRPVTGDSIIYVKTNPGTEVRIRIPGLENVSNRIVHRAELKVCQVPDNAITDGLLALPPAMYLERVDTLNRNPQKFLTIPYDLSPAESYGTCFPTTNGINYTYFGSYPLTETTTGTQIKVYNFNISRYVQQIVTHQLANYPLRLTANLYAKYDGCTITTPFRVTGNSINFGRAKLGGGAPRGSRWPYKMRLRIIYSRI